MLKAIITIYAVYAIFRLVFGRKKGAEKASGTARTVHRQQPSSNSARTPAANLSVPPVTQSSEGESAEEHERHLMSTVHEGIYSEGQSVESPVFGTEGESDIEHALHMDSADHANTIINSAVSRKMCAFSYRPDRNALRRSIIMREILDPPLSLRRPRR